MRSPVTNPFEPGADRIPQVWAGRHDQLADWRDRLRPRRAIGQNERGRTLLGEPGIGKSVLVRRIARAAADTGDWVTPQIRIPRGVDPMPLLAGAVWQLAEDAGIASRAEQGMGRFLDRVREVSVMGASVRVDAPGADGGIPAHTALTQVLVALGRAARADGRVVLVHVDEVQNITDDDQRSQVLVALGDALGHEEEVALPGGTATTGLPIAVYLTGLPEFHDQASSRSGATFARRFATTVLAPIQDADLAEALHVFVSEGWPVAAGDGLATVTMTPAAVDRIVHLCHGDPFLFQLAGQHAWDAGRTDTVTVADVDTGWRTAAREARTHVERLVTRLPELERSFVATMAGLPPGERTLTRIASELGYERASQLGPTAQRLDTVRGIISRGRPYSFRIRTVEALLTSDWPDLPD
jgi:hypothetical protein